MNAEVKTKGKPFKNLDFLSFTDKQYDRMGKENFKIFYVCNVKDENEDNVEIYEFDSDQLKEYAPKRYTSFEYNKSIILSGTTIGKK